jgi:hypothetical protein
LFELSFQYRSVVEDAVETERLVGAVGIVTTGAIVTEATFEYVE